MHILHCEAGASEICTCFVSALVCLRRRCALRRRLTNLQFVAPGPSEQDQDIRRASATIVDWKDASESRMQRETSCFLNDSHRAGPDHSRY